MESFAVLGGSGVTAAGAAGTLIDGDVGSAPTPAVTGFPPAVVTAGFVVYEAAHAVTAAARADAGTAFAQLAAQTCPPGNVIAGGTLGGLDLGPGVYCMPTGSLTGTLTLTGGRADIWVFQITTDTLTTASASSIVMARGASACHVLAGQHTLKDPAACYAPVPILSRIPMRMLPVLVLVVAVSVSSCSGSPTDPDQDSVNGCFAVVGNRGTVTASISGLPGFSGIVATGAATFVPPTGATPGLFIVQGLDVSSGTSVLVGGPAVLGPTTASLATLNGSAVQILVTTRSCTAATGLWTANLVVGSATVNVTSVSASGVSGSFNGTLDASPGSGAVGTKTISGSFTATF